MSEVAGTAVVTGARGFVGRHLCMHLLAAGSRVRVLDRDADAVSGCEPLPAGLALESDTSAWVEALTGVDYVYHLAGIAHRQADEALLRAVNEESPVRLFQAAQAADVSAFVWLSSIKALGATSREPFTEVSPPAPVDVYGASKARGEARLLAVRDTAATRLAVVRPPLVYGPGVKANFLSLLGLARLAALGVPLLLGAATAPRSLVGVANLCDLLLRLRATGSGILHVRDARDLGVAELVAMLARPAGQPVRLWRVADQTMGRWLRLVRREDIFERLFSPLQLDQQATCAQLDWQPPHASERLLAETMAWFRQRR